MDSRRNHSSMSRQRLKRALGVLSVAVAPLLQGAPAMQTFRVSEFGAVPDGATDCGPAVARALEAVARASGPTAVVFDRPGTYRVLSAPHDTFLRLQGMKDVTVDGGGGVFLLHPRLNVLDVTGSRNIRIRNFKVDYAPLPLREALVVGADPSGRWIDVRVLDEFDPPPVDPAPVSKPRFPFFGMLWRPADGGWIEGGHYFIEQIVRSDSPDVRRLRVYAAPRSYGRTGEVQPGTDRFTLPVRGLAHCGDARLQVRHSRDVRFENVDIWCSPYFSFVISDNEGVLVFRNVNIRPKPGTRRLTSSWRDGFHVKDNRAELTWEDCELAGLQDDAFNISSMTWRIEQVKVPDRIVIQQVFPASRMKEMRPGDVLVTYSVPRGRILGRARIVEADNPPIAGGRLVKELRLDTALSGLDRETCVWDEALCNPKNTIRNCSIVGTSRLRCPVLIENCRIQGLLWFYGDSIEGPLPRNVAVRNCFLIKGKGNPRLLLATGSGFRTRTGRHCPMQAPDYRNFTFEGNRVEGGDIEFRNCTGLRLIGNTVRQGRLTLHNVRELELRDLRMNGRLVKDAAELTSARRAP